jgi:hypothetical protein
MMSEADEKSKGWTTSIYVKDKASFQELQRKLKEQGRSLSEVMGEFTSKTLAEFKGAADGGAGTVEEAQIRYVSLKQQYSKLLAETAKSNHWLKEQGLFDPAVKLFGQTIGPDVSETSDEDGECEGRIVTFLEAASDAEFKDAAGKFLARALNKGKSQLGHAFVTYLEDLRQRFQLERQLLVFRPVDQAALSAEKTKATTEELFVPNASGRQGMSFEEWKRRLWEEWNCLTRDEQSRKKRPACLGHPWTERMKREHLRQMDEYNRLVREGRVGRVVQMQDEQDEADSEQDIPEDEEEEDTLEVDRGPSIGEILQEEREAAKEGGEETAEEEGGE